MRSKVIALLAVALVAALVPATVAVNAVQPSTHTNHANPTPGTARCAFTHPTSLPSHASPNATDAHADRSNHCPPTHTDSSAAQVPAMMVNGVSTSTLASASSTHDNNANPSPGTARCTFTHPTSLPSHASPNATDALADRSSHCPPTTAAN